jgi:hypothetical protein
MVDIVNPLTILPQGATPNMEIYKNKYDAISNEYAANKETFQTLGLQFRKDEVEVAPKYAPIVQSTWNNVLSDVKTFVDMGDYVGLDGIIDDSAYKYLSDKNLATAKYNTAIYNKGQEDMQKLLLSGDLTYEMKSQLDAKQPLPDIQQDGTLQKMQQFDLGVKYNSPNPVISQLLQRTGSYTAETANKKIDINKVEFHTLRKNDAIPTDAVEIPGLLSNGTAYVSNDGGHLFLKYTDNIEGSMSSWLGDKELYIYTALSNDQTIMPYYDKMAELYRSNGITHQNGDPFTSIELMLDDTKLIGKLAYVKKTSTGEEDHLNYLGNTDKTPESPPKTTGYVVPITVEHTASKRKNKRNIVNDFTALSNDSSDLFNTKVSIQQAELNIANLQRELNDPANANNVHKKDELARKVIELRNLKDKYKTSQVSYNIKSDIFKRTIHEQYKNNNIKYTGNSIISDEQVNALNLAFSKPSNPNETNTEFIPDLSSIVEDIMYVIDNYMPSTKDIAIEFLLRNAGIETLDVQVGLNEYVTKKLKEQGDIPTNPMHRSMYDQHINTLENLVNFKIGDIIREYNNALKSSVNNGEIAIETGLVIGSDETNELLSNLVKTKLNGVIRGFDINGNNLADDAASETKSSIEGALIHNGVITPTLNSQDGYMLIGVAYSSSDQSLSGNNTRGLHNTYVYLDAKTTKSIVNEIITTTNLSDDLKDKFAYIIKQDDNGIYMTSHSKLATVANIGESNLSKYQIDGLPDVWDVDAEGNYIHNDADSDAIRDNMPKGEIVYREMYINWLKQSNEDILPQIVYKTEDNNYVSVYPIIDETGMLNVSFNRPEAEDLNKVCDYFPDIHSAFNETMKLIDLMRTSR